MNKRILSTVAIAAVSTLGLALPAIAADYTGVGSVTVGPESGYWNFDDYLYASLQDAGNDTWENNNDGDSTWDDTSAYLIGTDLNETQMACATPADLSEATDGSGDWIYTCDPQTVTTSDGALVVTTELRFFADGKTVRSRYIIANESNSAVTGNVLRIEYNAYQDDSTSVSWTADGGMVGDWTTDYSTTTDLMTVATDYIWVTDDREALDTHAPVVKYAVGVEDALSPLLDTADFGSGDQGSGDDDANLYYAVPTMEPGDVIEYVSMAKVYLFNDGMDNDINMNGWEEGTKYAVDQAILDTDLESDEYVFAGIETPTRVLNWVAEGGASNENNSDGGLASTGFDARLFGGVAILALVGGAAVVARRRFVK